MPHNLNFPPSPPTLFELWWMRRRRFIQSVFIRRAFIVLEELMHASHVINIEEKNK